MRESEIQQQFFSIVHLRSGTMPQLSYVHAIPNGGKRSIKTAVTMKREGQLSGVWDVFAPIPSNGFSGLYMECKTEKGKLTDNQKWFREGLEDNYAFSIFRTPAEGYELLMAYIEKGFHNA